jgi:hypothetical protein
MTSLFRLLAAVDTKINPSDIGIDHPVKDANGALSSILTTVYGVAGVVCVIIIVIAGFTYVTSSGDPSTVKRAREAIIGAVTGIIVIMLAFVITGFVLGRF